jgi:hypothetical protein
LNCGTSSIWAASYLYDKAGDLITWNHPAGFTITQNINGAREISQVTSTLSDSTTHPGTLATVTYTPFGAVQTLQNGCVPTANCTNLQESYFYNPRLQMAVAELGTSGTHSADSCRVYNYYAGANNASACSESTWPQGSNNDGDVAGYYYTDPGWTNDLCHSAAYVYGAINRLETATAKDCSSNTLWSQNTAYDQYGNMSCTPAGPGCVNFSYNAANNQIVGYTYGGRGNVLTNDGTNTYNWLSDGRLSSVVNGSGTTISANTYNALGQRVRDVTQTGTFDEAYGAGGELLWRYTGSSTDPNQRAFVPLNGGILAEYYSGGTLFDHGDELGSITASTSYNGSVCQERLFYPWGELWTGAGGSCGMHQTFAQLPDYDAEIDQYKHPEPPLLPHGPLDEPRSGQRRRRPQRSADLERLRVRKK